MAYPVVVFADLPALDGSGRFVTTVWKFERVYAEWNVIFCNQDGRKAMFSLDDGQEVTGFDPFLWPEERVPTYGPSNLDLNSLEQIRTAFAEESPQPA